MPLHALWGNPPPAAPPRTSSSTRVLVQAQLGKLYRLVHGEETAPAGVATEPPVPAPATVAQGPASTTRPVAANARATALNAADRAIRDGALVALQQAARFDLRRVVVEVSDGVVTLTGTVSAWSARMAAEDLAQEVCGVREVFNEIGYAAP